MQDDNFQDDLFGKGAPSRKPPKIGILDECVRQRYLPYLKMPTEYAVIALIGVLVLLTLSYAFGVKVGRASAPFTGITGVDNPILSEDIPKEDLLADIKSYDSRDGHAEKPDVYPDDTLFDETYIKPEETVFREDINSLPGPEERSQPEDTSRVVPLKGAYIIHLAAFREEGRAKALSDKLTDSGREAGVARKGDWYQVFTSGYKTILEANSARDMLKKDYADCYIRKVE